MARITPVEGAGSGEAPGVPDPVAVAEPSEAPAPPIPFVDADAAATQPVTVSSAVDAIVEAVSTASEEQITMTDTTQTMADAAQANADKTQSMMAGMNDRAKSAMEKGSKMLEEMNEFGKGNVEAMVESSRIAAKGFEKLGQDAADYSRRSFESATAAFRSMSGVKSPTELFKLQSDYMRQAFDTMVAETSKTTESMLKLAGDVASPISNRVALAADKVKVAA